MIETQVREAMLSAGIDPPVNIRVDGGLHRFDNGERGKSGWYVIFPDGVPAGRFGCWKSGVDTAWRAQIDRPLTVHENMLHVKRMTEAKKMRDAAREAAQAAAADSAQDMWDAATDCDSHTYLTRKGVSPNGSRVDSDGRLVIPVYGMSGEIQSLQFIADNGEKRFLKSGKMLCGHYIMGDYQSGPIYIAEGFATAATIHEATGGACVVAFSARNLSDVTAFARGAFGATRDIVIVGDNDESGTGQKYATEAAEQNGCRVVIPPSIGDVNDYGQSGGDVRALLVPDIKSGWLVPVSEFCKQPAPIRWLIRDWVQAEALIMVHGPSGAGKSFLVLDWVLRVSGGVGLWFKKKVSGGKVVYLAGEGHHGLKGRISAWSARNGIKPRDMWLSSGGCDLNTPEGYIIALESIKGLSITPVLIVVDTLHRFLSGDENSAQDAKTMIDACGGLMREFGCSVILVHHTGAGGTDRGRGSTAWRGALDIEIGITPGENGGQIKISQHKSKDSEAASAVYASLESQEIPGWVDEDGGAVKSAVIVETDVQASKSKPNKDQHMKVFTNAWFASGAEARDKRPYLSRSALKDKLTIDGRSDRTIKNDINPSYNDKLIGFLVLNGYIKGFEHGWIVTNDTEASAMMVSRLER